MLDRYESHVKEFFASTYELDLRKIREDELPRPDFEVFHREQQIAFLEVKAIESTAMEVTADSFTEEGIVPGSLRIDNAAARVAKKVHEAVRQLKSVSLPKILVLLNVRSEADDFDLVEFLQGYLVFADGTKLTFLPPSVTRRSATDKTKIDLYLWVDIEGGEPLVIPGTLVGKELKSAYFVGSDEGNAG